MTIDELMPQKCVRHELSATDISGAVRELAELANKAGRVQDVDAATEAVLAREACRSTCLGGGVAFPRASAIGVESLTLCVGRFKAPITCQCGKQHPVALVLVLFGPLPRGFMFLKAMAAVSQGFIKHPDKRVRLIRAFDQDDLFHTFVSLFD